MTDANCLHDKVEADLLSTKKLMQHYNSSFFRQSTKPMLDVLKDPIFNFADVTPKQILAHMVNMYGGMTDMDSEASRKRLSSVRE